METKILQSINLIRRGSGVNRYLFRYAAKSCGSQGVVTATSYGASDEHPFSIHSASIGDRWNTRVWKYAAVLLCFLMIGVGEMWGSNTYYSQLQAIGKSGEGYVYADTSSTATPQYAKTSESDKQSSSTSQQEDTYYAWAMPVRGSDFTGWTATSGSPKISGSSNPYTVKVKESSSNKGTNKGVITANWTTCNAVNVTYNPSRYGVYYVSYLYNSYDSGSKTISQVDAEGLSRSITSDGGAQTIGSYHNDIIILKSTSGELQGWFSDAACTVALTGITDNGDGTYTYVVPDSGTVSIYAQYPEVEIYQGRLTASIAEVPYSMPGGGMIYIAADASEGDYSDAAQTVSNSGMGTTSITYYLHAQPTDKRYVFRGWYSDAACTSLISPDADYTYNFTSSSTDAENPTTGNVYAAFDFNLYYMEVQAQPATPGLGMVLVSDTKLTSPEYTQYSSESSQFAYAYRLTHTTDVYVYAKPKYGYKLSGWYTDAACTIAASVASDGKYTASSTESTDPLNPDTITLYAKFVEESKVSITYNLPDKSKGEYVAFALDIEEIDDEFVWTRTELYNSNNYTANTTLSQYKTDVLILDAEPKSGYGVTAWSDNGTSKSSLSHIYQTDATSAKSFGVTFGEAKPFLVSRNSTYYSDLQEAITATNGSGRITVVQNAYVPAGTYTIPSGVTLVVPFDANGSNYTSLSSTYTVHASWSQPSCYSKLTLASGCTINVNNNAVINVAAKEFEPDGGNKGVGAVATAYGQIDMEAGSAINVHSGGKLYCWGYITGDGMVTIENGAAVTEMLQTVSRGGNAFSSFAETSEGDHCFPLNQYYIQNIEAYLRVNYGATETVWTSLYIRGDIITSGTFIGSNGSGFFELSSGSYLIRKYDPTTDRINYDIYGSAKLSHLSITIYISIDTKNYTMPITNNMTINCHAIGDTPATITVSYRMALLPSAVLSIGKNVTVDVSKKLYVYDRDEWVGKSFSYLGTDVTPICYSPTKTKTRASADLVDAKIVVNGTLKCSGEVYTTSSGAQICSSSNDGTGIVHFAAAAGTDANTYQAVQSGSSISTPAIPMTSAKLQNGDGSYVTTVGSAAGSKFYYSKSNEKWMKDPKTITWDANEGKTADATTVYSDGSFLGELPAAYKEGHTFAGWWTAASGGAQIEATTKVTDNAIYYAHWTANQYKITYMDQGKAAFSGTHIDTPNAHPTKHIYGTATTLNSVNDKTGYTFGGWHTISNCKAESKVTSLAADGYTKDITLYAKWTPQTYTITYKDKDDADFSGTSWESNQPTEHTYGTATTLVNPSKPNYTFGGWYTTQACTGSAVTSLGATAYTVNITLYAKWNETTHTVTVSAGANGSVSPAFVSGVGAATASGNITATPNTGYNFSGWTLPESGVTAASGYTTSSNPIHINATADDKTITANWSAVTYNLTYEGLNGATNSNPSIYTIETATISLADPGAREGYTFTGWTCGGNSITQIALGSTGNKTITATWTINKYKVTFDSNGGNAVSTIEQDYNTAVTAPADPTREGYTFAGWNPAVPSPMPASNTNCVAQWTANPHTPYTVKHYKQKLDGSYAATPDETDYLDGPTDASVTPARKNYAGFTAPAGQTVTILANGSLVVTYQYTRNSYNLSWSSNGGNELTGNYTTGSVKYGATITAPNDPTRTGYSFSGWSPAYTGTMPATNTEYQAQWTPEKRTVTWKDGTTTIKIEEWNYDSKPSFNYVKTPTAQYSFPLLKWEDEATGTQYDPDNLPLINADVTYKAIYGNVTNKYTIRFVNDGGTELQVINDIPYGDSPEYTGETPASEIHDYYIREFKGWSPEIVEVEGHTTYTARYEIVAKLEIKEEYVVPTTTIVETTTVEVGGSLNVASEEKLTTTDLIIESSADEDWNEVTSGEVVAVESAISADNAYYDMKPAGGYKARIWYAVAVPWTVDVPTGVAGHVYDANGRALRLDIDFDLLYYDGAQRAAGGTNNWRYVAQEEAENQVMKPGKAYMIYLASPTSKLRFEKSSGKWLTKELPLEHYAETTGNDGKDANWNGIANPAIYRAYLNAGTDENWGQVFVPGSAPRDGGTYAPVDMSTYKLAVGQPIFVQAENTEKETVVAYQSNTDYKNHAPRRAQADAAEQEARYAVEIAVNGKRGDRIFIATDEDKEDVYTIGRDVVKMGLSNTKPQMWINRYDSKLCVNTIEFNGTTAVYPLTIQIPTEGEYSLYTPSDILTGHELYLTYNGRSIWNLRYAPYVDTFTAGTHAEYGLKLVRSNMPTDIDQTGAEQKNVRKMIVDDHVYIIRGNNVYTVDGQLVK